MMQHAGSNGKGERIVFTYHLHVDDNYILDVNINHNMIIHPSQWNVPAANHTL